MKKIFIISLFSILLFNSCYDLDIAPKNLITDKDLLASESGMDIYMARMYSNMPFEDFKYMARWGFNFSSWLGSMGIEGTGEAINRDDICRAFVGEDNEYWGKSFPILRDANFLIENLPKYEGNFAAGVYNHYMGEAYFVRAFVFYTMAKRYGGIPLVTKVIQYPADQSTLEIPRSSEEETWDQVLSDFDTAISLLSNQPLKDGYSSRYIALAFKSEAMLYAGSVAKYNDKVQGRLTGLGRKTGVRVIGFDENRSADASKRYFTEAYKSASEVMKDGGYDLYKKKWAANDKEAQYQNMVDMFSDLSSPENIYVRKYIYPTITHGYDAYSAPLIFRAPLSSGTCPTLDFVELFDGFERYADGTIKVTDGISNTDGEYRMFDTPMDFFKDAEPRLRAYVIFPGDMFKGKKIEIRAGVYTGTTPIKPLFDNYSYANAETHYQDLKAYTDKPKSLYLSPNMENQEVVTYSDGEKMTAGGENGPFYNSGEAAATGFYGRKWLNPDPSFVAGEGKSAQPFILMRYAEVLLNAAEAAVELSMAGVTSPDGKDLLGVATTAVNDIRNRAGATQLTSNITATEGGRDVVRKERRKELAFEHKTKWDLRRWRVQDYTNRAGFWGETRDKEKFSSNSQYRFRGLYPFFSTVTKKYFFDARFQWTANRTADYSAIDYYFGIPGGEVTKSPVIDQQPNR